MFDANVFAQALMSSRGPAAQLIAAAARNLLELCVADHVLRAIAALPNKLPQRRNVTDTRVREFVTDLLTYARRVPVVPPVFAYDRDPDDAAYVDLAVAAGAGYLVTRDKDLLDLSADTPEGRAFAARNPALHVVDPVALLSLLPDQQ